MVAGEAGGDIEPEGGVMWTWTEIFGWAALLSLPAVMIGVELGGAPFAAGGDDWG
jgi:hypothetical protein